MAWWRLLVLATTVPALLSLTDVGAARMVVGGLASVAVAAIALVSTHTSGVSRAAQRAM
jgi:hypothetical protein